MKRLGTAAAAEAKPGSLDQARYSVPSEEAEGYGDLIPLCD